MSELLQAIQNTKTTCPYCGVGCGVVVRTQGGKIIDVKGDETHPANLGKLCSKGSKLAETATVNVYGQVRASQPLLRIQRDQQVAPTDWNTALDFTAREFARLIATYGPDSVGFYISGQLLTEDYYVFNKLAKGLIGTNNIDTNSRLCMSSAVSGYKRTLGADAPPCNYDDLALADCVFIAGSNMAYAHPVAYRRLEAARAAKPGHKLIVVDPRATDTALMADLHLKIQPGTDVMLFNAMLHVMMQNGWLDMAYINKHTEGFDAVAKGLVDYTPKLAASVCGVPEGDIVTAATWFAQSNRTLSLYCQGLNQATTGTDKNTSLIALHLATGQIGKEGSGPFSLTGQPNAMGGREVGGLSTLLPAHRELNNPAHVAEVAKFWGVKKISATPGASAVEMFDQLEQGKIKAVWVACTNPAHSLPNSQKVARALQNAELVVVQDAYLTPATVQYADVLLPATTWGEKEGTVTNSERRISRVRPAMPAYADSKNDWQIVVEFAKRLEVELEKLGVESPRINSGPQAFMPYSNTEEIFNEHRETTRGRDLDITGLSYAVLETKGPQQWPMPEGVAEGKARLYEDGVYPTATGKAKFVFANYEPVAEEADARFPWRLNTGRLRDQWHGASRTGTLAEFFSHEAEPVIALHPADFKRLNLKPNSWVSVKSRRATITLRAKEDESVARNQAVLPMHWGPEFFGGKSGVGGVNALTIEAFDPYSKQPELKHSAVNIQRVHLPWQVVVFVYSEHWLSLWQKARALYPEFDAAVCVPVGREQTGVLFRAASAQAPAKEVIDRLQSLFECEGGDVMVYSDPKTDARRRIGVKVQTSPQGQTATLNKVFLAGNIESEGWLRNYFDQQLDVMPLRSFLLAPESQPPGVQTEAVRMVCNCVGVSEQAIQAGIAIACAKSPGSNLCADENQLLSGLQGSLKCGTQCGSCVPEIRKLIRAQASLATMAS
ncbi:nitrate reductase [Limnobacter sp. P1]|uniref:nitrate reductase n=1 Tax=Limnobacter olei TaxID=3031298 RepID=UPI0023AEE57A|nr:nitrate reductase [Limnobacter sp. P1]